MSLHVFFIFAEKLKEENLYWMLSYTVSRPSAKWWLTLLIIVALAFHLGAAEENAVLTSDEDFEALDLEDLYTKLSDLYQGKIKLKEYDTKEKVISALKKKELELKEEAAFEEEVEAAAARRERAFGDIVHSVHVILDVKSGYGKTYDAMKEFFQMALPNFEDLEFSVEPYIQKSRAQTFTSFLPYIGYSCLLLAVGVSFLPLPERIKGFIRARPQIFVTTGLLLAQAGSYRTTAFEVQVDKQLVYSGLQSQRPPSAAYLRQILLKKTLLQDYP